MAVAGILPSEQVKSKAQIQFEKLVEDCFVGPVKFIQQLDKYKSIKEIEEDDIIRAGMGQSKVAEFQAITQLIENSKTGKQEHSLNFNVTIQGYPAISLLMLGGPHSIRVLLAAQLNKLDWSNPQGFFKNYPPLLQLIHTFVMFEKLGSSFFKKEDFFQLLEVLTDLTQRDFITSHHWGFSVLRSEIYLMALEDKKDADADADQNQDKKILNQTIESPFSDLFNLSILMFQRINFETEEEITQCKAVFARLFDVLIKKNVIHECWRLVNKKREWIWATLKTDEKSPFLMLIEHILLHFPIAQMDFPFEDASFDLLQATLNIYLKHKDVDKYLQFLENIPCTEANQIFIVKALFDIGEVILENFPQKITQLKIFADKLPLNAKLKRLVDEEIFTPTVMASLLPASSSAYSSSSSSSMSSSSSSLVSAMSSLILIKEQPQSAKETSFWNQTNQLGITNFTELLLKSSMKNCDEKITVQLEALIRTGEITSGIDWLKPAVSEISYEKFERTIREGNTPLELLFKLFKYTENPIYEKIIQNLMDSNLLARLFLNASNLSEMIDLFVHSENPKTLQILHYLLEHVSLDRLEFKQFDSFSFIALRYFAQKGNVAAFNFCINKLKDLYEYQLEEFLPIIEPIFYAISVESCHPSQRRQTIRNIVGTICLLEEPESRAAVLNEMLKHCRKKRDPILNEFERMLGSASAPAFATSTASVSASASSESVSAPAAASDMPLRSSLSFQ